VIDLLNSGPQDYSGTFGEAQKELLKQSEELIKAIADGKIPTKEQLGKYKNVCKALKKGIDAWKDDIKKQFPEPRTAEINKLLTDINQEGTNLQDLLDCNGTGYAPQIDPEPKQKGGPAFEEIVLFTCNFELGKAAALKIGELMVKEPVEDTSKTIVALFTGADIGASITGLSWGITEPIEHEFNQYFNTGKKGIVEKFQSSYFNTKTVQTGVVSAPQSVVITGGEGDLDKDISLALEFIKSQKRNLKDKVIILGYSWGGVLSMHLSRKLKNSGISVDFLIIIDAANGFWSDEVNRSIPTNVRETQNFWQDKPKLEGTFLEWSRGYPASGSNVVNIKVTQVGGGIQANHTNIPDYVLKSGIVQTIISKIK
jgi:hypothetical protein